MFRKRKTLVQRVAQKVRKFFRMVKIMATLTVGAAIGFAIAMVLL